MSKKKCAYKNCDTQCNNTNNFTLFAFPKDPERFEKWVEISQCSHVPDSQKFLCEKHFDRIYICRNPRRKTLVGEAVPIRLQEQEDNDQMNRLFFDNIQAYEQYGEINSEKFENSKEFSDSSEECSADDFSQIEYLTKVDEGKMDDGFETLLAEEDTSITHEPQLGDYFAEFRVVKLKLLFL